MRRPFLIFTFVLAMWTLHIASVNAQSILEQFDDQGSFKLIRGKILDPTDSPLPIAKVLLKNESDGTEYWVETDDNGLFKIKGLREGKYLVWVSASGFNTTTFTLSVDKN